MSKTVACEEPILTSPEDLQVLRRSLLEEMDTVVSLYRQDVHAAQEIREEGVEDEEELASMDFDRDLLFTLSEVEREKLRQIEEALQRMDEGSYGLCFEDGRPIPVDRLRQVPWARYCAGHQELVEEGLLREV
jgi:DnaK suppressor protein